jgi:hypothetical protein
MGAAQELLAPVTGKPQRKTFRFDAIGALRGIGRIYNYQLTYFTYRPLSARASSRPGALEHGFHSPSPAARGVLTP